MITEKELISIKNEYEDLFENYLSFMLKNNILFNVSSSLFDNFPRELPESIRNNFEKYVDEFPVKDSTLKKYSMKIKSLQKQIIKEVKKNPDISIEDMQTIGQGFEEMTTLEKVLALGLVGLVIFLALLDPDLFANEDIRKLLTEDSEIQFTQDN